MFLGEVNNKILHQHELNKKTWNLGQFWEGPVQSYLLSFCIWMSRGYMDPIKAGSYHISMGFTVFSLPLGVELYMTPLKTGDIWAHFVVVNVMFHPM